MVGRGGGGERRQGGDALCLPDDTAYACAENRLRPAPPHQYDKLCSNVQPYLFPAIPVIIIIINSANNIILATDGIPLILRV